MRHPTRPLERNLGRIVETPQVLRLHSNIVEKPDKLHEEASKAFREVGSRIGSFAVERPKFCWGVPKPEVISDVSIEFVGLSNGMYSKAGITADMLATVKKQEQTISQT